MIFLDPVAEFNRRFALAWVEREEARLLNPSEVKGLRTNPGIDKIAARLEPKARRAFTDAVQRLKGAVKLAALERALSSGSVQMVEEALGLDRLADELQPLAEIVLDAFRKGGSATATALDLGIRFDITDTRALAWVDQRSTLLIREVTDETRAGVRSVVRRGFTEGRAPRDTARLLRGQLRAPNGRYIGGRLGLTEYQAGIVANYEAALRSAVAGEMSFGALDERFALNPLRSLGGLTEQRIMEAVARYEARLLAMRAETIARTETLTAANAGRRGSWRQLQERGALAVDQKREWLTAEDERTCPTCLPLDGALADLEGTFPGGYDGPPAHPRCRCSEALKFGP